MRSSIVIAVEHIAGILVGVAHAAVDAELLDDVQDHILGVDARAQLAAHLDAAHLEPAHGEGLRGEHVAHLAGADAERQRAERAVGGRVRVAAADGHARLGEPALRADDVHHALLARRRAEEGDAEVAAVVLDCLKHLLGHGVAQGARLAVGGDDVVHRGEGALRVLHRPPVLAQRAKRLRARHLVDELKPHEQLGLPRRQCAHRVEVEDFLVKVLSHGLVTSPCSRRIRAG